MVEEETNTMVYFQADSHSGDLGLDTVGKLCTYTHLIIVECTSSLTAKGREKGALIH